MKSDMDISKGEGRVPLSEGRLRPPVSLAGFRVGRSPQVGGGMTWGPLGQEINGIRSTGRTLTVSTVSYTHLTLPTKRIV